MMVSYCASPIFLRGSGAPSQRLMVMRCVRLEILVRVKVGGGFGVGEGCVGRVESGVGDWWLGLGVLMAVFW